MTEYLSPSVGMVIPHLDQVCNELTRQALIRSINDYTKQLCEADPELADIILEGEKTLSRCIRYVLEQAQTVIAKNVEAMIEDEFKTLDEITVRGKKAVMAGAAVSDEEVYAWAKAYYYGGKEVEPGEKKKTEPAKLVKNESAKKDTAKRTTSKKKDSAGGKIAADTDKAKDKGEMAGGTQIAFGEYQATPAA